MKQKIMHCFLCALLTLTCLTVCATNENDTKSWLRKKIENSDICSKESVAKILGFFSKENAQKAKEWIKEHPGSAVLGGSFISAGFFRKFRLPFSSLPFYASLVGIAAGAGIVVLHKEYPQCVERFFKPNNTAKS